MDIFTIIRRVAAVLCGELSDAAANVTPATPAERARFGALLQVCSLLRAAMERASAADAATPKVRHDILRAIRNGLDRLDTDARRTGRVGASKAYATQKVTAYTRDLLGLLAREKEAVA